MNIFDDGVSNGNDSGVEDGRTASFGNSGRDRERDTLEELWDDECDI